MYPARFQCSHKRVTSLKFRKDVLVWHQEHQNDWAIICGHITSRPFTLNTITLTNTSTCKGFYTNVGNKLQKTHNTHTCAEENKPKKQYKKQRKTKLNNLVHLRDISTENCLLPNAWKCINKIKKNSKSNKSEVELKPLKSQQNADKLPRYVYICCA